MNKRVSLVIGLVSVVALFHQCTKPAKDTLFVEMPSDETGITFNNEVVQSEDNHILNYSYFFNGGGVAVGDFNNDGLVDIYFSANQKSNKLYGYRGS